MRWRADPKKEASVKTHRGTSTAGGLTIKRNGEKSGANDSSETRASAEQPKLFISHIRAEASFTASLPSTESSSSPSPRILQPNDLRVVTSLRRSTAPGGGGAYTQHAVLSCKQWAEELKMRIIMSRNDGKNCFQIKIEFVLFYNNRVFITLICKHFIYAF